MKKFYALTQEDGNDTAELYIFGDIASWGSKNTSAKNLSDQLKELSASHIDVYINSYGGEVAEGLAIYNALRNHSASVTTHCEGFACSIASVIFMAGDERVVEPASLLMIHNPWAAVAGNAAEMRKAADDLETIGNAIKAAYKSYITLDDDKLDELMDAESWIEPDDAVTWGFATSVNADEPEETDDVAASVVGRVVSLVKNGLKPQQRPTKLVSLKDAQDALWEVIAAWDTQKEAQAREKQPKPEKPVNLFSAFAEGE